MDNSNKRFRVYFDDGTNATYRIDEIEYAVSAQNPGKVIVLRNHDRSFLRALSLDHITHIESEEPISQTSAVVLPPSPQTIRQQQEDDKLKANANLENVLAKDRSEA